MIAMVSTRGAREGRREAPREHPAATEDGTVKGLGFNHIDLGTKDMEATRAFYEDVLGFPLVRADLIEIGDQGVMKHFFFDVGNGQLIGFMSGEDVEGYPKEFDSGINRGLGLARGVYHFAFDADSLETLEETRKHLEAHGVEVRGPVDHEGWSKSIYFFDPNGLQLECCHLMRPFVADDATPRVRFRLEGRTKKPAHAG
jgi:catechol 2,3-dioxygenase-like lactoylglutathione lyase family enzyme